MKTLLTVLLFSSVAFAAPQAASKMSHEDMLELENVALKMDALQRQAEQLNTRRSDVLAKYHIKAAELGREVQVSPDGTIQRQAQAKK